MRTHLPLTLRLSFFLSVFAVSLSAAAQDIFVTPFPGAPFSATIQVQRTLIQPGGSSLELHTVRQIARDNAGRIHNEARILEPAGSTTPPEIRSIHL